MNKNIIKTCLRIAKNHLPNHQRKDGHKHYTFVIQENKLVTWSTNKSGTMINGTRYANYQMYHSEFMACKLAKGLLNHQLPFEIINIRMTKSGKLKNSKPCPKCQALLKDFGCKVVVYSTEEFSKMHLGEH